MPPATCTCTGGIDDQSFASTNKDGQAAREVADLATKLLKTKNEARKLQLISAKELFELEKEISTEGVQYMAARDEYRRVLTLPAPSLLSCVAELEAGVGAKGQEAGGSDDAA